MHAKGMQVYIMPSIAHFDLPADEPERAKGFYEKLFGWKFISLPGMDYYLIETEYPDGRKGVGGGMGKRTEPDERILNYIGVDSVDDGLKKVIDLGGKVVRPKMPVPGWGWLAVCTDTEGNRFGLWEEDKDAKPGSVP